MRVRQFRPEDEARLREIHAEAGYLHSFPELSALVSSHVVEEDGKVVAWAGAQMQAEVMGLIDTKWKAGPSQKMKAWVRLHFPVAQDLRERGVTKVYANFDPAFKGFARHLYRLGGWMKPLWGSLWLRVSDVLDKDKR